MILTMKIDMNFWHSNIMKADKFEIFPSYFLKRNNEITQQFFGYIVKWLMQDSLNLPESEIVDD